MTEEKAKLPDHITRIVDLITDKKGHNIAILDLDKISAFTSHMIICSAESSRQAKTISDHILKKLKDQKVKASHIEGYNQSNWILMDYIDFIVNIFNPKTREFYQLEKLWHDAPRFDFAYYKEKLNISLIWPGKTKNQPINSLIEDYLQRCNRFTKVNQIITRTASGAKKIALEEEKILAQVPSKSYIVLLDEKGKTFTSIEFANEINRVMSSGYNSMVFVVCGESGCTKVLKDKSNMVLSLTPFTFTHEMARLILTEQVYRALTILNNHPYHND